MALLTAAVIYLQSFAVAVSLEGKCFLLKSARAEEPPVVSPCSITSDKRGRAHFPGEGRAHAAFLICSHQNKVMMLTRVSSAYAPSALNVQLAAD